MLPHGAHRSHFNRQLLKSAIVQSVLCQTIQCIVAKTDQRTRYLLTVQSSGNACSPFLLVQQPLPLCQASQAVPNHLEQLPVVSFILGIPLLSSSRLAITSLRPVWSGVQTFTQRPRRWVVDGLFCSLCIIGTVRAPFASTFMVVVSPVSLDLWDAYLAWGANVLANRTSNGRSRLRLNLPHVQTLSIRASPGPSP